MSRIFTSVAEKSVEVKCDDFGLNRKEEHPNESKHARIWLNGAGQIQVMSNRRSAIITFDEFVDACNKLCDNFEAKQKQALADTLGSINKGD